MDRLGHRSRQKPDCAGNVQRLSNTAKCGVIDEKLRKLGRTRRFRQVGGAWSHPIHTDATRTKLFSHPARPLGRSVNG